MSQCGGGLISDDAEAWSYGVRMNVIYSYIMVLRRLCRIETKLTYPNRLDACCKFFFREASGMNAMSTLR